ncbi:MAG: hypothetical protein ORN23_00150 [Chthoniobacterales bacterium]|nr:hypothetical protein [Chthoniobacterales bacterium]
MPRNITTTLSAQGGISLAAHHPLSPGINTTPAHETIPLEAHPPISMDCFVQQSGLSPVTLWRFRKKGWLKTCVIAGRHYITREELPGSTLGWNRESSPGTVPKHLPGHE